MHGLYTWGPRSMPPGRTSILLTSHEGTIIPRKRSSALKSLNMEDKNLLIKRVAYQ